MKAGVLELGPLMLTFKVSLQTLHWFVSYPVGDPAGCSLVFLSLQFSGQNFVLAFCLV